MPCIECGAEVIPEEPPRYDVLNPEVDLESPEEAGPYCPSCFVETTTGQQVENLEQTAGEDESHGEEEEEGTP